MIRFKKWNVACHQTFVNNTPNKNENNDRVMNQRNVSFRSTQLFSAIDWCFSCTCDDIRLWKRFSANLSYYRRNVAARTEGTMQQITNATEHKRRRGRSYSRRRDCRTNIYIEVFREYSLLLSVIPRFLGRSLAAVYNVNERSLHVGPPLLDNGFAKESAKRPSVCGGTPGKRREGNNRALSPADLSSIIGSNNDTRYLIGRISVLLSVYIS